MMTVLIYFFMPLFSQIDLMVLAATGGTAVSVKNSIFWGR
jgi:hypothetical protein